MRKYNAGLEQFIIRCDICIREFIEDEEHSFVIDKENYCMDCYIKEFGEPESE